MVNLDLDGMLSLSPGFGPYWQLTAGTMSGYSAIIAITLSIGFLAGHLVAKRSSREKYLKESSTFGLDDDCKMVESRYLILQLQLLKMPLTPSIRRQ